MHTSSLNKGYRQGGNPKQGELSQLDPLCLKGLAEECGLHPSGNRTQICSLGQWQSYDVIHQTFAEDLLCTRYWGVTGKQDKYGPGTAELVFQGGKTRQ